MFLAFSSLSWQPPFTITCKGIKIHVNNSALLAFLLIKFTKFSKRHFLEIQRIIDLYSSTQGRADRWSTNFQLIGKNKNLKIFFSDFLKSFFIDFPLYLRQAFHPLFSQRFIIYIMYNFLYCLRQMTDNKFQRKNSFICQIWEGLVSYQMTYRI